MDWSPCYCCPLCSCWCLEHRLSRCRIRRCSCRCRLCVFVAAAAPNSSTSTSTTRSAVSAGCVEDYRLLRNVDISNAGISIFIPRVHFLFHQHKNIDQWVLWNKASQKPTQVMRSFRKCSSQYFGLVNFVIKRKVCDILNGCWES